MHYILGSDHAGVQLKKGLAAYLVSQGESVDVLGSDDAHTPVDYPDATDELIETMLSCEEEALGILVCGTGIGVSIRANRYMGARAAVIYDAHTAASAKQHTNANILCFGERSISAEDACHYLDVFIKSTYEGGRHETRIEKCDAPCVD